MQCHITKNTLFHTALFCNFAIGMATKTSRFGSLERKWWKNIFIGVCRTLLRGVPKIHFPRFFTDFHHQYITLRAETFAFFKATFSATFVKMGKLMTKVILIGLKKINCISFSFYVKPKQEKWQNRKKNLLLAKVFFYANFNFNEL